VKAVDYPEPFLRLARQLRRLPGIGARSAERIALWIVSSPDARASDLSEAIAAATSGVCACRRCGFFSTGELCVICLDPMRSGRELCVVENATDVLPLERSGAYGGVYHVLGGKLSPLDRIGPEDLRIEELSARVREERPSEVILALGGDVEGEATAGYLFEILRGEGVPISRIAQGLPAGGGLEHADQLTLHRALSGRRGL